MEGNCCFCLDIPQRPPAGLMGPLLLPARKRQVLFPLCGGLLGEHEEPSSEAGAWLSGCPNGSGGCRMGTRTHQAPEDPSGQVHLLLRALLLQLLHPTFLLLNHKMIRGVAPIAHAESPCSSSRQQH